ncbi:MAG: peroxiredoxin, partial [Solirubrobacteraceae bacterium]
SGTGLAAGAKAPDFSLEDQNGRRVSSADLRGRNVVVYFYPKDDTPGCTREACSFRDQYTDFTDAGAAVYGISSDSPASHLKFAAKYELPFTLLSDPDGVVRAAFGVPATLGLLPGRVTYVIDKQGVIRHAFNSQLSPARHVAEALQVLGRLS